KELLLCSIRTSHIKSRPMLRLCHATCRPRCHRSLFASNPAMRAAVAFLVVACGLMGQQAYAAKPEVIVDPGGVPPAALRSIMGAVDAITRLAEDQDGGELSRLRRRARDATLSALETQGYFSSKVTLEASEDAVGEVWDITIEPAERTV